MRKPLEGSTVLTRDLGDQEPCEFIAVLGPGMARAYHYFDYYEVKDGIMRFLKLAPPAEDDQDDRLVAATRLDSPWLIYNTANVEIVNEKEYLEAHIEEQKAMAKHNHGLKKSIEGFLDSLEKDAETDPEMEERRLRGRTPYA